MELQRFPCVIHFRTPTVVLIAALWLSWNAGSAQAQAQEVIASLPIDAVTVYYGSASITRSGEIDIPAGASTVVLENLPGGLNPALLQLAIADSDVRFSNLQIQENYREEAGNARERELRDRLQTLRDQRQVIDDRVETARSELRLLDNLLTGDSGARPSIDGDELASLIRVVSESSAQARQRIREANLELRALDQQIDEVQFQLDQVANNRRSSSRLRINVESDETVTAGITLTYPQGNVSWNWLYETRLDTASRRLSLFRQASISQGSGEDWQDITLTLSSAAPDINPDTPELQPLFVDTRQRGLARQRASDNMALQEVVVTGSRLATERGPTTFSAATTIDTRYQVDHVISGRVSVAADRQPRVFPVDRRVFDVELVSRAVPSRQTRAYLEARFDYDGEAPIQNALMQLYRDGARIGQSAVRQMLPGQSVRIPFGVDRRIEVARFDEQQDSGSSGIFNRNDVREERLRYEITSRHPEPVAVEVLDQIPVSRNEDITVDIPRQATPADETDVDGEAGLMLWQQELAPQETAVIRHYYDIRYPQDADIIVTP